MPAAARDIIAFVLGALLDAALTVATQVELPLPIPSPLHLHLSSLPHSQTNLSRHILIVL